MAVVVEATNIVMDFILAVWTELGIPRTAATLTLKALHVGSLTVRIDGALKCRWSVGSSLRVSRAASGNSVTNETFFAGWQWGFSVSVHSSMSIQETGWYSTGAPLAHQGAHLARTE